MKLFQIEEPKVAPLSAGAPGAAVGIDFYNDSAAVAVALGGNAEILPGGDGERRMTVVGWKLDNVLLALRVRAERQLARPVTHVVIAAADERYGPVLTKAAKMAGLTVLRVVAHRNIAGKDTDADAAVLAVARLAEDLTLDGILAP